jgi:plastocyanin
MRSQMKIVTFLFLVVISMVAVSCGPGNQANQASQQTPTSPPSASASQMTVNIFTDQSGLFGFSPKTLPVTVGTTVTWKNTTLVAHTVTSDDGASFDSGIVPAGGTFTFTFTKAGSFAYHCDIHPYMKATIVVK